MRALVLAAGSGERLRPLTADRPKPMIEIGGKPILQYNLELLARAGVRETAVNLHYMPDVIRGFFGDGSAFGMALTYSYEPVLLGTAGAARNVAEFLRGDDFLVVYGDNLSTIDLTAAIARHREKFADLTMAVYHREDPAASGIAALDGDDRVTDFLEKPAEHEVFSRWVNAGYLIARSTILDRIPSDRPSDFARDVIPALLGAGAAVYAYRMTERLWWIDSPADYERTRADFEGKRA
ncbi:MAG: nucleotidyltransferase family protein [Candidatus Eremiobacteraeota bacterium]|nr:nucleotidyltransferase family protein [Candidatus Eremiobacteraeota bacterium]MBV8435164.1 nucleotidyltransferase family protein [Candidatus Eremiobacteraeota bacterium]MBV8584098.1 nucleotidyltransferase family protein [Candidatus Eremiobacteraeota bacterium]